MILISLIILTIVSWIAFGLAEKDKRDCQKEIRALWDENDRLIKIIQNQSGRIMRLEKDVNVFEHEAHKLTAEIRKLKYQNKELKRKAKGVREAICQELREQVYFDHGDDIDGDKKGYWYWEIGNDAFSGINSGWFKTEKEAKNSFELFLKEFILE